MSVGSSTERPWRARLGARARSAWPWVSRVELDALRCEVERSIAHTAALDLARGQQLGKLSDDLTALVGVGLVENAASHELLAQQFTDLVDGRAADDALTHRVLSRRIDDMSQIAGDLSLTDDPKGSYAAARRKLHDALAWQPTWSSVARLVGEPLISVIVPTRNRCALLERALDSVSRQTYANWEVVVVNDASTDDTGEVLAKLASRDARFRVVETSGLGCGGARQFGYERVRGELVAYLDDDNVMVEGWLRAVVEALGRRGDVGAVYGAQLREQADAEPLLLFEPFDELRLLEGNFIDIGAFAHRRVDGIEHRSNADGIEDWDFILAFAEMHRIQPLPVVASVYMTHAPGRLSDDPARMAAHERVRSQAVRTRLADPGFVADAVRTVVDDSLPSVACPTEPTGPDIHAGLQILFSLAGRREHGLRILEWASAISHDRLRSLLRREAVEAHWLVVTATGGNPLDPHDADRDRPVFDATTAQLTDVADAVQRAEVTELHVGVGSSVEDPGAVTASTFATIPLTLGLQFDAIIIGSHLQRKCLAVAASLVAPDGFVLVERGSSTPVTDSGAFGSWRPFGDGFWIGSITDTDFTDVVPVRAILRGMAASSEVADHEP